MLKTVRCIVVDDEPVARDVLESLLSRIEVVELVAKCKNAVEAFNIINMQEIDLVFLDINMPEISGLSFARSINPEIKIIFTTAYREYAVEGFDLQAVDYLLKPISFERLLQSVNRFLRQNHIAKTENPSIESPADNDYMFVRSERKMIKVTFDNLLYIESIGDYVKLFMREKTVVTRESLSGIEARLPKDDFLRIHRSFIVAINKIESYTGETIDIKNKELPVSRTYKDSVIRVLSSKNI
ncbi:MAG: LytTR family DNA-binding domain-containing protein [Marinilabiliaceae bacterium]|jgi:DNA-binding LytR/AlgR family response regulator|nr:LytTR family DNA-binding domain-containing protein [Marinilabiliaceae bacterium]